MKIAIIGAGLIGKKRALSLPKEVVLKTVCDVNESSAKSFAKGFNCFPTTNLKNVLGDKEIEALIIATPNGFLAELARKAIICGKHVLIEKPGATNKKGLETIWKEYKKNPVVVMFGYNHRFHPAIQKAKEIADSKKFGEILFIRAKYGHGGRLGYEKEWRFNEKLSGGGELIDQGSHLIDLTNFFIGPIDKIKSLTSTVFWKTNLEDTAFLLMGNKKGQMVSLSTSCVEWKNIFCFEIMLEKAKIQIDGLSGSYGTERLTLFKMKPEMGLPDVEEISFPAPDLSWKKENEVFFNRIKSKDFSEEPFKQASYVFDIIEKVYKENKK
ncbi:MAG: hypothetical protein A2172_03685 [Candidatus Woykebacteria bacterium RBG_13_40_15]|uniref:Oxidoreductase n=1 Tax=Candidatus Woykebacteria bacterium RBG_13_40_15 TaxID=1802593 RepID=A0A1G1WAF1_9BACT|nr:MAG: hypothetical protein A2172_03685 [Candidatus Woykebacteria bacterium RBG_13_40_15]